MVEELKQVSFHSLQTNFIGLLLLNGANKVTFLDIKTHFLGISFRWTITWILILCGLLEGRQL